MVSQFVCWLQQVGSPKAVLALPDNQPQTVTPTLSPHALTRPLSIPPTLTAAHRGHASRSPCTNTFKCSLSTLLVILVLIRMDQKRHLQQKWEGGGIKLAADSYFTRTHTYLTILLSQPFFRHINRYHQYL